MFFAPPKVKSLSRYAEYGAYLGNRHFLMMLAIAFTAHLAVIVIYSLRPSQEIIKIPVRVLNIKLTGGGSASAMQMPLSASMPEVKDSAEDREAGTLPPEGMKAVRADNPESVVDKALGANHPKPVHQAHMAKEAQKGVHAPVVDFTFSTPKRYVRAGEAASGKSVVGGSGRGKTGSGNGSEVSGDIGGNEVIERYTQTISQWIKNHQLYAKAVCGQAQATGGQCDAKGQVVVRIRIDRDGHILYNSVDKTSGKELVDQAAIAMVRASDPVPGVPGNYPDNQMEFLIAVQVDLSKQ